MEINKNYRRSYSKYRNQKIVKNGMKFDSIKEWQRYLVLCEKLRNNEIYDLQRQYKFILVKGRDGVRDITYIADFVYFLPTGERVIEDVKGIKTEVYKIKAKMMYLILGEKVIEI